uniref:Uncharacterized protein n=1 Tax=Anguilla anguilla TaxID=7936 RepID=A0A0E9RHF9_ANGAN
MITFISKWRTLGTVVNLPRSGQPAKNFSKGTAITHPGSHKGSQKNIQRTVGLSPQLRSVFMTPH